MSGRSMNGLRAGVRRDRVLPGRKGLRPGLWNGDRAAEQIHAGCGAAAVLTEVADLQHLRRAQVPRIFGDGFPNPPEAEDFNILN